jgi:NADH dehydrogenase
MTCVLHAVTGAFSFTGRFIARELLARGHRVRTLSRRDDPAHPLAGAVDVAPLQFADAGALARSLHGVDVLFNTYWVRFPRGSMAWADVLWNTRVLLGAARRAGVRRVVQLSVTGCAEDSPLAYYRMKALAERELRDCGVEWAVVRPTLIFGDGDILLNNIAWVLRRMPVFLVAGSGAYRVQPVAAEEVARLAVEAGLAGPSGAVLDAAGPRAHPFIELVRLVRAAVGSRALVVRAPAAVTVGAARVASVVLHDELLTRAELDGVMGELLCGRDGPGGGAALGDWLARAAPALGRTYVSERRRNWT